MTRGLFITGTDTGVGKTYVAALIARTLAAVGHRVGVYKPVSSGCRREAGGLVSDDAVALWEAAGRPGELERVSPQCFEAPLAPHLAARAEGGQVDAERLHSGLDYWLERSDVVVVEGVGGLMSPMADEVYNADLAAEFGYALVVVSPNVLGTINGTLQTLITASTYCDGLDVAGVVLNDVAPAADDVSTSSNLDELVARCVPPILASVAWQAGSFEEEVDWYALAKTPAADAISE